MRIFQRQFTILIGLSFMFFFQCHKPQEKMPISIDMEKKTLSFQGVIYPERYNSRKDRANGHHLIVWSGGGNARKALINTESPDIEILNALTTIGAIPGNNLSPETWTDRDDPNSPEPDKLVEGDEISIKVTWDDVAHNIDELLLDTSKDDLEIRFGGHAELIPVWKSGCITCLFSCPGGRTSNASYSIRDQHLNHKTFMADQSKLPPDGTNVRIFIKIITD